MSNEQEALGALELLPCPFCGGDALQEWSRDAIGEVSYIVCTECSGQADHRQAWNTRTPPAPSTSKALRYLKEIRAKAAFQRCFDPNPTVDETLADIIGLAIAAEAALATPPASDKPPMRDAAVGVEALRQYGWSVAVHNDYRLNGEQRTFWLFTHPDGTWIKGEGVDDEAAIAEAHASLRTITTPTSVEEPAKGAVGATQRLAAVRDGAGLDQVYGREWCFDRAAQFRADLAAALASPLNAVAPASDEQVEADS